MGCRVLGVCVVNLTLMEEEFLKMKKAIFDHGS